MENCLIKDFLISQLIAIYLRRYLISRFWQVSISQGFTFAISIGKYDKEHWISRFKRSQLDFTFQPSELLKYRDKLKQAKRIINVIS